MSQIIADTLKLIADNQDVILSAVRLAATNKEITMATLKISDLSVGDWVMVYGKPRKISVLAEVWNGSNEVLVGYVVHVNPNGYNVVYYKPIEHIKPIPITAEILENNGWLPPRAGIDGDTWWWTNKVDTAIEASEYQGEWQLTIIEQKEIQYNYRLGLGLKYVHQLQNALRLAGVEKEINL